MSRENTCIVCGGTFLAEYPQRRTCSPECALSRQRARGIAQYHKHKGRRPVQHKARYDADPERYRSYHYKHRYGVTLADVKAMFAAQGEACAICREGISITGKYRAELAAVDHCHTTKAVRGLLCRNCNLMLGHAKDRPEVLRRAITYLGAAA